MAKFLFGYNMDGQLGLGHNNDNINIPTLMMIDRTIKDIMTSRWHTIIYKGNGDVFVFWE